MLKKTMQSRRRHILTLLFSAYFMLYVLTPFCFTQDGMPGEYSPVAYRTDLAKKNIRVIWQLVLSDIFKQGQENSEDTRSHVQFLIKKPKAISRSGKSVKFSGTGDGEISLSEIPFHTEYSTALIQFKDTFFHGFISRSYSGLSPPAA